MMYAAYIWCIYRTHIICTLSSWWHPSVHVSFIPTNPASSLESLSTSGWMWTYCSSIKNLISSYWSFGTKQQHLAFSDLTNLSLSNYIIPLKVSSSARNIGFIFDFDMIFLWSNQTCVYFLTICQFHIQDTRRIHHLNSSSFCSHRSCKFTCHEQT